MRKGITPVISIVLLLLIVVAIIGIAFGWFVGIFNVAADQGTQGIEDTVDKFGQISSIESAVCENIGDPLADTITLYVKASGSSDLAIGDVSVYLDDVLIGSNRAIITSGSTATLTFVNGALLDGTGAAITIVCPTGTSEIRTTDPAGVGSDATIEA